MEEASLQRSLELYYHYALSLKLSGRTLYYLNREGGDRDPEAGCEAEPVGGDNYALLALDYCRQEDQERAIVVWIQALALQPNKVRFMNSLGRGGE